MCVFAVQAEQSRLLSVNRICLLITDRLVASRADAINLVVYEKSDPEKESNPNNEIVERAMDKASYRRYRQELQQQQQHRRWWLPEIGSLRGYWKDCKRHRRIISHRLHDVSKSWNTFVSSCRLREFSLFVCVWEGRKKWRNLQDGINNDASTAVAWWLHSI